MPGYFILKNQHSPSTARQRLKAIQEFTQLGSGYQLATRDMEIRGVGNLLGAEQSGQMDVIGFDSVYGNAARSDRRDSRTRNSPS